MDNIIVGIDPGTTTAFAIMNLRTEQVVFDCERNLGLNALIKKILSYGFIVAVGSDKKPCPLFVERFASKTGAKLIVPDINLSVEKKMKLTKDFKYKNDHERDALSALMNAYKKLKHTLTNINNFFDGKNLCERDKNSIERLVLRGHSIKDSVDIIKNKRKDDEMARMIQRTKDIGKKEKKLSEEKKLPRSKRTKKEEAAIRKLDRDTAILKEENRKLKHKITQLNRFINELMHKINKSRNVVDKTLYSEVLAENKLLKEKLNKREEEIKKSGEKLDNVLNRINEGIVVQKFPNLLFRDVKSELKHLNTSLIMVENPNEYSLEAIKELKKKITTIIFAREPNKRIKRELNLNFINIKSLKVFFKSEKFVLIQKEGLSKEVNTKDKLEKLIYTYKKSRIKDKHV